jgi:branched-chain amino acid transport system ATP-binding protein
MSNIVLKIDSVTKKFGGLVAVNSVSLDIERGSIVAIIGPNGAGKTTLLNLVSGLLYPDEGRIYFEGRDITRRKPHERARMGIGRSFQNLGVITGFTVYESIVVASMGSRGNGMLSLILRGGEEMQSLDQEVLKIAKIVGLNGKEHYIVRQLTQAEQRKLDIAMALASRPRLLLLDEPTSGLAVEDIPNIIESIRRLRRTYGDLTIILVEHKIEVVRDLAERVVVLKEGRVIADGSYSEVINNREVIEAYIGDDIA